MKKASKVTLLEVDDVVIGVVLGANYTAEHETGIRPLLGTLDIDDAGRFLEGRSMRSGVTGRYRQIGYQKTNTYYITNEETKKRSTKKVTEKALALGSVGYSGNDAGTVKMHGDRYDLDTDMVGAWDSREFCLIAWTDKGKDIIKLISDGMESGDLSVWLGGGHNNPFDRAGLVIARTSMIPEEQREQMRAGDQAQIDLEAAALATGITKKLDAVNHIDPDARGGMTFAQRPRGHHALSPRMISEEEKAERKTAYNVIFYLNPHNQPKYNYGWFTVEELEQWIEDKGPIVKTTT